jgi:flagellar protein FlaG
MDIRSVDNATQPAPAPANKKISTAESSYTVKAAAQPAVEAATAPQPTPTLAQVTQAVNSINDAIKAMSQDVEFSVDADTDKTIIKLVDKKTKEVLRQIPSPEVLAIAKALDQAQGLLIKQKA